MGKGTTGIKILNTGEEWRKLYLSGSHPVVIAAQTGKNQQVISRAIWLAKIPEDIKGLIRTNPEVFTRRILLNTFAAKRRQCEKDGFQLLRTEVQRMVLEGAGSKPTLKKTTKRKKKEKLVHPTNISQKLNSIFKIEEALTLENRIREMLGGLHSRVMFDEKSEGGEVRLSFKNNKDLEFILNRLEDLGYNSTSQTNTNKKDFLGLL